MFDIENLALISGLSETEVRTFLPSVLSAVRSYTNKGFLTNISIAGTIQVQDNKIICSSEIPSEMTSDSQIELRYSINNTKIYTIKSIENNEIEVYEKLFDEEFEGFIIKLCFNIDEDIIASMLNYKKTIGRYSAIKSESLDGYSYTLNVENNTKGYPQSLLGSLSALKQLPGSIEREYYERGFTKIPF